MLRMDQQRGRPVLIEFWDFCRPNSLRTLPYVKAWNERYEAAGLRVIGVHTAGFDPSRDSDAVRAAVARLGIEYAVGIDAEQEIWQLYDNLGWPARYLFNADGYLDYYHYGEGAYEETELAIQALLGDRRPTLAPLRPEDAPGAQLSVQSEDVPGPYSGPYEAGGRVGGARRRGRGERQRTANRREPPGRLRAHRPPAQHGRGARARARGRRRVPRRLLHARAGLGRRHSAAPSGIGPPGAGGG